ncbi:MAG: hypothetical protein Q9220_005876 [cf. Caloplaca sp. 1 TL-2023]
MPPPPSASARSQPSSTTRTLTLTSTPTLCLRAPSTSPPPPTSQRRIHWASTVVDNENLGRKSSKVCCIYHRPREVGESSSSDSDPSSSSSSDSDSSDDDGAASDNYDDGKARMTGASKKGQARRTPHEHDDCAGDERNGHVHDEGQHQSSGGGSSTSKPRRGKRKHDRRNAYETQPLPRRKEGQREEKRER